MATLTDAPRLSAKARELVEARIDEVRRRLRVIDLIRTGLVALAGLFLTYAAYRFVDRYTDVPPAAFWGGMALTLAAIAGYVYWSLFRVERRAINPLYAARELERVLPQARNAVVNYVDLRDEERLAGSLKDAIATRASKEVCNVDVDQAIDGSGVVTRALILGAAFFAAMLAVFLPPIRTTLRLMEPEAGDVSVLAGQDLRISAEVGGRIPAAGAADAARLRLWYNPEAPEQFEDRPLAQDEGDRSRWGVTLPAKQLRSGFRYQILAGDAMTAAHEVKVRVIPEFVGFDVTVTPPAELGLAATETGDPNVVGYYGSVVSLTARANRPVKFAHMFRDGSNISVEAKIDEAEPQAMKFEFPLESQGGYRIEFTTVEGDSNPSPRRYTLTLLDPKPGFRFFGVRYEYPAYLRWKPTTLQALRAANLEAIQGTKVEILGTANRAVASAEMAREIDEKTIAAAVDSQSPRVAKFVVPPLKKDDRFRLTLAPKTGEPAATSPAHTISVTTDAPPRPRLDKPELDDSEVAANAMVPLAGFVADDHGIAEVRLRMAVISPAPRALGSKPYRSEKGLRRERDDSYPTRLEYHELLNLADAKDDKGTPANLKAGETIELWLEANDNRRVPEIGLFPNLGTSNRKRIKLIAPPPEQKKGENDQKNQDLKQKQQANEQKQDDKLNKEERDPNQPQPKEGEKGENDPQQNKNGKGENDPQTKNDAKGENNPPKEGEQSKGGNNTPNEGDPKEGEQPKEGNPEASKSGKPKEGGNPDSKQGTQGPNETPQQKADREKVENELNNLEGNETKTPEKGPMPKEAGEKGKENPKKDNTSDPGKETTGKEPNKGENTPKDDGKGGNPMKGDNSKGGNPTGKEDNKGDNNPKSAEDKKAELERESGTPGKDKPSERESQKGDAERLSKNVDESIDKGDQKQREDAVNEAGDAAGKSKAAQKQIEDELDRLKKKKKTQEERDAIDQAKEDIRKRAEEAREKGGTPEDKKDNTPPKKGDGEGDPNMKKEGPKEPGKGDNTPKDDGKQPMGKEDNKGENNPRTPEDKKAELERESGTPGKDKPSERESQKGDAERLSKNVDESIDKGDQKQREDAVNEAGDAAGKSKAAQKQIEDELDRLKKKKKTQEERDAIDQAKEDIRKRAEEAREKGGTPEDKKDNTPPKKGGGEGDPDMKKAEPKEPGKGETGEPKKEDGKDQTPGKANTGEPAKGKGGQPMGKGGQPMGKGDDTTQEKQPPEKIDKMPREDGKKGETPDDKSPDNMFDPKKGNPNAKGDANGDPAKEFGKGGNGNTKALPADPADPANRLKAAELQLERFEKNANNDDLLKKLNWSKEQMDDFIAAEQERLKQLRAQAAKATPDVIRQGASALNQGGNVQGSGKEGGDLSRGSRGAAPQPYAEAQREFSEAIQGAKKPR